MCSQTNFGCFPPSQLDLVDTTDAVFSHHLHLRRVPQVHPASQPWGLGGAGDVLLTLWSRLRQAACLHTTTRPHLSLQHATLLVFPYSNNLRAIYTYHQISGGLSDPIGGPTIRWLCYVIVSDWQQESSGLTSVILGSFFQYNDYACCSNNKYLCRSIPVR